MTKRRFHCSWIVAATAVLALLAVGPAAGHRSFDMLADAQSEADAWSGLGRPKGTVVLTDAKTEADAWHDIRA